MTSILGTVWVDDFDRGVITSLGGELVTYSVDGVVRQAYVIRVPGLQTDLADLNGMVPINFVYPEETYRPHIYPCFVVRRNALTPAFERQAWYGVAARAPAQDATQVQIPAEQDLPAVNGYTKYSHQWRGSPSDISYDLQIMARTSRDHLKMLHHVMRKLEPPWFIIEVIDTKGDTRQYDAGEISMTQASELADISGRVVAMTQSFTVRAELDVREEYEVTSLHTRPSLTLTRYEPN